jgi:hypothetical protein
MRNDKIESLESQNEMMLINDFDSDSDEGK